MDKTTEELRIFKRKFVTGLVKDGVPERMAEISVDLALHHVQETERRLVEAAKSTGDIDTGQIMLAVASKMLYGLGDAIKSTLINIASEEAELAELVSELTGQDPVEWMLKRKGVVVDYETQGVVLHGGDDADDCSCEACAFARKMRAMEGVTAHELEDGITAFVMPLELAAKLAVERAGTTIQ